MKTILYIELQPSTTIMAGGFLIALIIAVTLIPNIIKYALKYNLVDIPDERKVHQIPTPRFGGLAIFFGTFLLTAIVATSFNNTLMLQLLALLFLVFILGITDDKASLKANFKFGVQIFIATAMTALGFRIESLHGLMGIGALPLAVQYPLSILIIVGLTNAFNLIDGIDGLAGGLALINSLIFAYLFYTLGRPLFALFSISLAGATFGFLLFNFKNAKIFMGDGGSLFIGFSMAILGIAFLKYMPQAPALTEMRNVSLVFSLMLVPVYDTVRVFAERIFQGKSPFHPDKTHIHHLLLKSGFNPTKAVFILYFTNLLLAYTAVHLEGMMLVYSFIILSLMSGLLSEWLNLKIWLMSEKKKESIKKQLLDISKTNQLFIRNQDSSLQ